MDAPATSRTCDAPASLCPTCCATLSCSFLYNHSCHSTFGVYSMLWPLNCHPLACNMGRHVSKVCKTTRGLSTASKCTLTWKVHVGVRHEHQMQCNRVIVQCSMTTSMATPAAMLTWQGTSHRGCDGRITNWLLGMILGAHEDQAKCHRCAC